jgi:hypothetical protein
MTVTSFKNLSHLIYNIKMKVCVAGPTQAITPKFGVGSSFQPGSARSRGRPQKLTPGGTPCSDPVWKTLKGKELGGGQHTKVAPWGGIILYYYYYTLPNGVYALRIGRGLGQQTKIVPRVGFVYKHLIFGGAHPNPKPAGSLDQSAQDYFMMKLWNSPRAAPGSPRL